MLTDFKLPELGENITAGTVVKINVKVGDSVKKDQPLLEIETDKATIEVPSPVNGIIKEILIKENAQVKIGQVMMKIEAGATIPVTKPTVAVSAKTETIPLPKVESKPSPSVAATQPFVAAQFSEVHSEVPAPPSVRRFAREIGIDITQVRGSGPGGRISTDDVKAFAKQLNITRSEAARAGIPTRPLPNFAKFGEIERKPMNNIRRTTAEHLTQAWNVIPHVTQFDKADLSELERIRKNFSAKGKKLSITPFLMKIMALGLKTFPQFNTSVDMQTNEIIYKKYYHIGVAVDTDRGLIVPVIHDVDKKSIIQLAKEVTEAAERARNKKTTLEELQGGCFTLTNLGGIGGTYFTPIIHWPEVAILGVSRAQWEAIYINNQFVPTFMLPLSLSYDHRVIDGADGARFIRWLAKTIEEPSMIDIKE